MSLVSEHQRSSEFAIGDAARLGLSMSVLEEILHQVQVPILVTDLQGCSLFSNRAWERFHPVPPPGVVLEDWLCQFRFFDADGVNPIPHDQAPLARVLRGETVHEYEYAVRDQHGDLRFRRANGQQILDSQGHPFAAAVELHDITDERRLQQELSFQSLNDALTGCANRSLFNDRVRSALSRGDRNGTAVGILLADINQFAWVNHEHGSVIGDRVLIELADKLSAIVRASDTLARIGGDRFAIVVEDVSCSEELVELAERCRGVLGDSLRIDDISLRLRLSVGLALIEPGNSTAEVALRNAEDALRHGRESHSSDVAVFNTPMQQRVTRRTEVRCEIEQGLSHDGLFVTYQPLVDPVSERIVGVEALVRLRSREGQLIGPDEFIPIAEEAGLCPAIDGFVFREALRQASSWRSEFEGLGETGFPFHVACNVSSRSLVSSDWYGAVMGALQEHEVPCEMVALELTETSAMRLTESARRDLLRLRSMGIHVGLDDFGTGFSSLCHLRDLPYDFLKIDRSFINEILHNSSDRAIVQATLSMAKDLGLGTVAEGVAEGPQAALLAEMGAGMLQGYYFGRPSTPEVIADSLRVAHGTGEIG
jgi:diguanylate cyclase (GGDEF)-like protein